MNAFPLNYEKRKKHCAETHDDNDKSNIMFPDERLRDTRSHSPALTMGHVDTRPASVQHVAAGHVSAYDTRPASQLSAHTLHAYGSSRSSTSSKHVPRPGHQRNLVIPGAKYSALHTNCRQKQHDQVKEN